jgi:hypothetical protein
MYKSILQTVTEAALQPIIRRADLLASSASVDNIRAFTNSRQDVRELIEKIAGDRLSKLNDLVRPIAQ